MSQAVMSQMTLAPDTFIRCLEDELMAYLNAGLEEVVDQMLDPESFKALDQTWHDIFAIKVEPGQVIVTDKRANIHVYRYKLERVG